jgi:hypothetical protein
VTANVTRPDVGLYVFTVQLLGDAVVPTDTVMFCVVSAAMTGFSVNVRDADAVPTTSAPIVASEMLVGSEYATTEVGAETDATNDDCTVPSGPRALTNR